MKTKFSQLKKLGFDLSKKTRTGVFVGCSQCSAMIINQIATHEKGCTRARKKCKGCDAIIPARDTFCSDCIPL